MRRGLGLLGLLVTVVIVAVVGVIAYQAGWSDGFAQHAPATGAAAPAGYPYYYGPHFFGFGWIFGLLFFLFFLWVIFRLAGFAFWGMRGMHGWGYGGGWHQYREERMREWHRQAHGEQPSTPGSPPPPPPPPDQRSV